MHQTLFCLLPNKFRYAMINKSIFSNYLNHCSCLKLQQLQSNLNSYTDHASVLSEKSCFNFHYLFLAGVF